jgi:Phosphoribosylamine-glycine ligase
MKILVVGSGGREHALAWKLGRSPDAERIFCAPGNAGTAEIAENVAISSGDLKALVRFARENRIDLTVIGPDDPLAAGIVDLFAAEKLRAFGPLNRRRALRPQKFSQKS